MSLTKPLILALTMCLSACLSQPDVPRIMSGIILDKQTGKPLNMVKVSLEVKEKGRSGIGPEGMHVPKIWSTPSQFTGDVDSQTWDFRKDGTFRFDLTHHYRSNSYKHLTISKLSAEKSGYQTFTLEYPHEQLTIHLSKE